MKRRKLGETFDVTPQQQEMLSNSDIDRQTAEHYFELGHKYLERYLRERDRFWNDLRDNNTIPKTAMYRYNVNNRNIQIVKLEPPDLMEQELKLKLLQEELARLKVRKHKMAKK